MKYVIIRLEDRTRTANPLIPLMECAKLPHWRGLAEAGAAGILRGTGKARISRFELHRTLWGIEAKDPLAIAGRWYALSANASLDMGETAWCCDFITQHNGVIADDTAGNITTDESRALIESLNDNLRLETRRWELGQGPHHLLIVRDPKLRNTEEKVLSAESHIGRSWRRSVPSGATGASLRLLLEQASKILEDHPVNQVRSDLGENPANLLWCWGPGVPQPVKTLLERSNKTGAILSNSFLLRGLAKGLGIRFEEGLKSFSEGDVNKWMKQALDVIERTDVTYLHIEINSTDPVERLCAMERLDRILLKALTDDVPDMDAWRLLTVVDMQKAGSSMVVGIGSGLPRKPVAKISSAAFARSGLHFTDGMSLNSWFMES